MAGEEGLMGGWQGGFDGGWQGVFHSAAVLISSYTSGLRFLEVHDCQK